MLRRARRLLLVPLLLSGLLPALERPAPAGACGDPGPSFGVSAQAAERLPAFARGELGLVSPSWRAGYLAVAYLHLAGHPPDPRAAASIAAAWTGPVPPADPDPTQVWRVARRDVAGAEGPAITTWRSTSRYAYYEACPADAFRAAARTLRERAASLGASSDEVRGWLEAQDLVFARCGGGPVALPAAPPAGWSAARAADRRYQIAAALLYDERFEDAARAFDDIGADPTSPWSELGGYLAARAVLRRATLTADPFDATLVADVERRLARVLADPARPAAHGPARRMLDLVHFRTDPARHLRAVAASLVAGDRSADAGQRVIDLDRAWSLLVLDRPRLDAATRDVELLEWTRVLSLPAEPARPLALARWTRLRSLPWLVAALSHVRATDPAAPALLAAAAAVSPSSPAAPTLAFHRVRLLAGAGRSGEARRLLRTLPLSRWDVPTQNAFRALALSLATSLEGWLASATRTERGGSGPITVLHEDARSTLRSRLALDTLREVVASERLPAELRLEIGRALFVRAIVLERHDVASDVARRLRALDPGQAAQLDPYLAARGPDRTGAGALVILREDATFGEPSIRSRPLPSGTPACPALFCEVEAPTYSAIHGVGAAEHPPRAQSRARDRAAADELRRLEESGTLLDALAGHVLAWADRAPDDPRVPEALHRLVQATRRASFHATSTPATGRASHRAFTLLHRRYPQDAWTARTRHWFR